MNAPLTFEGEDSVDLTHAMSDAAAILSTVADVKGIVLLVFLDEQPTGAVSLIAKGQLPSPEDIAKVLETLLTRKDTSRG